jgi:hypothetical protein
MVEKSRSCGLEAGCAAASACLPTCEMAAAVNPAVTIAEITNELLQLRWRLALAVTDPDTMLSADCKSRWLVVLEQLDKMITSQGVPATAESLRSLLASIDCTELARSTADWGEVPS